MTLIIPVIQISISEYFIIPFDISFRLCSMVQKCHVSAHKGPSAVQAVDEPAWSGVGEFYQQQQVYNRSGAGRRQ